MTTGNQTERINEVIDSISEAVVTDEEFLKTVLTGIIANGHLLLEDVPGTGKTLTARSVANALGMEFSRIQFTPDLLPADVTGSSIYKKETGEMEFQKGPIFANIVLADEINRAPPKTQAALLEAMGERQVTTEGETHDLPEPFFVIATQNPVEQEGTFPLPEAQLDRFWLKTSMGYPERSGEVDILLRRQSREASMPEAPEVTSTEEVRSLQAAVEDVDASVDMCEYMVDLARATREHPNTDAGVSPRGLQRLLEVSRARAVLEGRDYVIPHDIKTVAHRTLAHRLVLNPEARVQEATKQGVIDDVLESVEVPTVDSEDVAAGAES